MKPKSAQARRRSSTRRRSRARSGSLVVGSCQDIDRRRCMFQVKTLYVGIVGFSSRATSSFLLSPEFYEGRPCWEVFYSSTVLPPDENRMGSETKYAWDLEGAKGWCQGQADKDFLAAQNAEFEARIRQIWRSSPAR
jgi:hypothetical protein